MVNRNSIRYFKQSQKLQIFDGISIVRLSFVTQQSKKEIYKICEAFAKEELARINEVDAT